MTKGKADAKHVLVLASTFPASDTDPVPRFVKDQIIALKKLYPHMSISVLAPHDARSNTADYVKHEYFDEYRFHYMWPRSFEKLAGRGIMPQLKKNPLYYLLIPNLFLGELLATKRLIRKLHPDYLYAHWFTPQGVVAGIAASDKTPVFITTHASDVAVWHKVPLGGTIVRHYAQKARAITAVSNRTLNKLKQFFNKAQWKKIEPRVKIIPMGVDVTPAKEAVKTSGRHILFIGRLAEKKGVHYLLLAFASLLSEFPNATLTIGGDGPLLSKLKQQANSLGLDKNTVRFLGYVSGKDKESLITQADIFVVPSIVTRSGDAEGLPVALMEGLAAGKVCVATNESNADEIITDSKDGFLVPHKDVAALAAALQKALSLGGSERARIQERAVKTAQQFSWDKIAKAHYDFLFKEQP